MLADVRSNHQRTASLIAHGFQPNVLFSSILEPFTYVLNPKHGYVSFQSVSTAHSQPNVSFSPALETFSHILDPMHVYVPVLSVSNVLG